MKTREILQMMERVRLDLFLAWVDKYSRSAHDYQLGICSRALQCYFFDRLNTLEVEYVKIIESGKVPEHEYMYQYRLVMEKVLKNYPSALLPKTRKILNITEYN